MGLSTKKITTDDTKIDELMVSSTKKMTLDDTKIDDTVNKI